MQEVFVSYFYDEDATRHQFIGVFANEADAVKKSVEFCASIPHLFETPIPLSCLLIETMGDFNKMIRTHANSSYGGGPGWYFHLTKRTVQ